MCHTSCIIFGVINLTKEDVIGKRVIEVGSLDINGSLREIINSYKPAEYIGVDIKEGPGVDMLCKAEELVEKFGKGSFDIVISTELLEHVRDWKRVISNFKNICRENGTILITTRSYGFGYHDFPYDFWRYELEDIKKIFSDCIIEKLETDKMYRGVFLKARKPSNFIENILSDHALYSIKVNKRVKEINEKIPMKLLSRLFWRKLKIKLNLKYKEII